jgi:hypothetical protein
MVQVTSHENPLLERGDIYFLYRPRVDREEAQGPKDVERFYMLLKPWHQQLYRLIVIGRKRLPDPKEHNRFYRAELNAEPPPPVPRPKACMRWSAMATTPISLT